jgi:SAM-dependent methyltransferase
LARSFHGLGFFRDRNPGVITPGGSLRYSIWEHSATVRDLYARRCRLQAEEMTCHAQAVDLLTPHIKPGETLLDAGCGSGYLYHSFRRRGIEIDYIGIDASPSLIAIGREIMPAHGLDPERLQVMRIDDLDGEVDHCVCINVLSNIDNYHRPLERLLQISRRSVVLRESLRESGSYCYVTDRYLDPDVDLKVHVNTYPIAEVEAFVRSYGFSVEAVTDRRVGDGPEMVIDHPHYWKFLVCTRTN